MDNIYFTTNSDGNSTEGIGAMAQYQIICYILSKLYGVEFYFEGFKNLTHYQYFNTTQEEWSNRVTEFFNFDAISNLNLNNINFSDIDCTLEEFISTNSNLIINFEAHFLLQFLDSYIDTPEIKNICEYLKNNVSLSNDKKYFKKENTNIAVHIRKYTETDCDPNPRRELFDDSRHAYVISTLKLIDENLKYDNKIYHIYSQGNESDFEFLKELKLNTKLHIEENPLVSLYHMINSDILITANSSLSYIAHLLGNHKDCFARDTFFHKWKHETHKII
jgi:hypothetical protein